MGFNTDLTGKRIVVCGSTQGIGWASAQSLAKLGASIVLVARNEEKLQNCVNNLTGTGHSYVSADFTKPAEMAEKVKAHLADLPNVYGLVNNSGGPAGGPIIDAEPSAFINTFNQHLIANQLLAQVVVAHFKKNGEGRMVNIISTSVKAPLTGLGVSNTIRGAVGNWSKTLANELGQFNITVNNVLPGATNTIRLQGIAENKSQKTGKSVEDIFAGMAAEVPMKRIAEADEVANAVVFLMTPAASYINGINIPVDGGRTPNL